MMRNSIATYKESLSRIASDVQEAADELEVLAPRDGEETLFSDRRISHRFAQSTSPSASPPANGINSGSRAEVELHKAEIQRLRTSETEIKTLAINYAAMLKEKEEELTRLHEQNSSLRKSLETKAAVANVSKLENLEGSDGQSTNRLYKYTSPSISPSVLSNGHRGVSKQEYSNNGSVQFGQLEGAQQKETGSPVNGSGRATPPTLAKYVSEIKELRFQLENERENSANVLLKFQEQQKQNESLSKELNELKMEREKTSLEMKKMQKDMDTKLSEIEQLQISRRDKDESSESLERLRSSILTFQNENSNLKLEKSQLEEKLRRIIDQREEKVESDDSVKLSRRLSDSDETNKEMQEKILQLESTLMTTRKERDKTLKELTRLKQHLLDKELEESDKMDEDSRLIEELRASIATQRAHILKLEKALNQENAKNEEAQRTKNDELRQANEIINGLKQKIANYANILESRNAELQNLQTALGQYYAEAEAKERLEGDVVAARAESARLSELLKVANEKLERLEAEKEEVVSKLTQAERTSSDGKLAVQRLQEDNLRLRRTLEQSMTRINRMSLDSDYSVDRRIVIKLLLTYFERNHGKEVLDLMVRMLGFSEEEKQRIVAAQQAAGKGVVRGVLGFPGRLVGGILGGGSRESSSALSENQSFADLWVDFLLKETEEREKRELAESTGALAGGSPGNSATPLRPHQSATIPDAEFATVPLTSPVNTSEHTRPISGSSSRY